MSVHLFLILFFYYFSFLEYYYLFYIFFKVNTIEILFEKPILTPYSKKYYRTHTLRMPLNGT